MNENIEKLLDYMEETITHLEDDGDEWLAGIVQQAFNFVEEQLEAKEI